MAVRKMVETKHLGETAVSPLEIMWCQEVSLSGKEALRDGQVGSAKEIVFLFLTFIIRKILY